MPQVSLAVGVAKLGVAGHSIVLGAGSAVIVGLVVSATVMVWLAVALLALTLARPLLKGSQLVPLQAAGNTSRVVLVDVSQSMSAGTAGSTAIARACGVRAASAAAVGLQPKVNVVPLAVITGALLSLVHL